MNPKDFIRQMKLGGGGKGIRNHEKNLLIKAVKNNSGEIIFKTTARLDTWVDVAYSENGWILPYVLRKIMNSGDTTA